MTSILNYTPLDEIREKIVKSKEFYLQHQTTLAKSKNTRKADLKFRIQQLQKLYYSIKDHEASVIDAMMLDFHRARQESVALEIIPLINDVLHMIECLPKWIKSRSIKDTSPPFMFGKIQVEKIARGSVLVISPFNFPLLLALTPVCNAIAAGNSVILKPSELTPNTALIMEKIIKDANLPDGLLQIVQGGIPETTELINSKSFDMIFYTGSPHVGSIVATAAAKNLTPCVLELGGKSPVFITKNFNLSKLQTTLRRIFFGAFANGGQICVRPDYLLVHESVYEIFVNEAKKILNEMFPELQANTEFTHLISKASYTRTVKKLDESKGQVYCPASFTLEEKDSNKLIFPPTIVCDCKWDDSLMQEENFAPVLPFIRFSDLDDAIDHIIELHDTPLVQYIFTNSQKDIDHILARVRSGDCVINETLIHVGIQEAPFGGIGNSGYGNYGGEYGFNAFTHERTVFKQPFWKDFMISMRYFPYSKKKTNLIQLATEKKPSFSRDGSPLWHKNPFFQLSMIVVLLTTILYSFYV